jgi:hypothetical protein
LGTQRWEVEPGCASQAGPPYGNFCISNNEWSGSMNVGSNAEKTVLLATVDITQQ